MEQTDTPHTPDRPAGPREDKSTQQPPADAAATSTDSSATPSDDPGFEPV